MVELAIPEDPVEFDRALEALPNRQAVFLVWAREGKPYLARTNVLRKRLMDEHIRIGLMYPRVKLNTTYSFGIDDQEFVVAFETNFPEDFLDLVQQLRETEISMYTLEDTPIFSCVRVPPAEMLDRLG